MQQEATVISAISGSLLAIPAAFWGAFIGAAVALLGGILANRHSAKQLTKQLSADAVEKAKQRRADLRRSVYLKAAEGLVQANTALGSLPQKDLSKVGASEDLREFFTSMMKLQLVGDPKTVLLANGLASSYSEMLVRTMVEVLPLRTVTDRLKLMDDVYERHQIEINRILAEMNARNEAGDVDMNIFDAKSRNLEFHKMQAVEVEQARALLRAEKISLQLQFMKWIATSMKPLASELLPLMVELRRELDVGGTYDDFKEMLDAQAARMDAVVEAFSAAVETARNGPPK